MRPEFFCTSLRGSAYLIIPFIFLSIPSVLPLADASQQAILEDTHLFSPAIGLSPRPEPPAPAEHTFTLRHIYHHGTHRHPRLHRKRDVSRDDASRIFLAAEARLPENDVPRLIAKSRANSIQRLADRRPSVIEPLIARSRAEGVIAALDASAWVIDNIASPDINDKETVLSLAYMSADAYVRDQNEPQWDDVGDPFNRSADFGWHSDGLRGHVFADETNSTVVIGLKGTSAAVFDGHGTTTKDKVNDNIFFSCCCGQQGQWTWHQVCDCATGTYSCNNTCVVKALREENHYYAAARELYSNVTGLYPYAAIWLTGHSLGGAITSFLGLTYGLPVVTFEAVPEALPASRLGLPVPPGVEPGLFQARENTGAYHFGHTADPVYTGTCNGATASCSFGGYAMETACHTGSECVWDVVADKGWRVSIGTHKIRAVINDVIRAYDQVPPCQPVPHCRDCAQWKMFESNSTRTSSPSTGPTSTTRTRTRTSTCHTPGWWGCLDPTTTGAPTATMPSTTTSSTSTCKTPGWFWCKDKAPMTETSSEVNTVSSTTSTCETPGWFGCKDPTTTAADVPTTASSTTCKTPDRLWGCLDSFSTRMTSGAMPGTLASLIPPSMTFSPTMPPDVAPTNRAHKCRRHNWLGLCAHWEGNAANNLRQGEM